jgi:hypothetical protein
MCPRLRNLRITRHPKLRHGKDQAIAYDCAHHVADLESLWAPVRKMARHAAIGHKRPRR